MAGKRCKKYVYLENNYEIIYHKDEIEIHDKRGRILVWTEEEWVGDPQVVFSICNAIQRVCEGKTLP